MLFLAVKIRPQRTPAGQLCNRRCVYLDFRKGRARRETELPGEDVEDTGETNQRRVFGDRAGRKLAQVDLALLGRGHARKFNHME